MHVLLTNDDGPPDAQASPYIEYFADELARSTDWTVSATVPHVQRSWIGKAHILSKNIATQYLYTSAAAVGARSEGPFDRRQPALAADAGLREWTLLDGTPATCANIGVNYLHRAHGEVDVVVSGPNFGRNTSTAYILSSGTVGAALEAAMAGKRAIALSFSYTQPRHPEAHVRAASAVALRVIRHLLATWHPGVQVYSLNVPLGDSLGPATPVRFVPQLENTWSAVYDEVDPADAGGRTEFRWAPKYGLCDETALAAGPGTDAWTVMHGEVSVTPLRAAFKPVDMPVGNLTVGDLPEAQGGVPSGAQGGAPAGGAPSGAPAGAAATNE